MSSKYTITCSESLNMREHHLEFTYEFNNEHNLAFSCFQLTNLERLRITFSFTFLHSQ